MELKNYQKSYAKKFDAVCEYISRDILALLQNIPPNIKEKTQEINLRLNKPVCLRCSDSSYYITQNGCITNAVLPQKMLCASKKDIVLTFQNICNYSVYSRQNEIINGFVTINGGHRAGICGTAVISENKIINIKEISSINIRIAREIIGCSDKLFSSLNNTIDGLLICGAPSSGKTTIIRDIARKLSADFNYKVSVVDERGEVCATVDGACQNNLGFCDVLDGYPKKQGIEHAVRCMSPDYIICDEIGTLSDLSAIEQGVNCGVKFIATLHCDSIENLLRRKYALRLLKTRAFNKVVFLKSRENAGEIKSVENCEAILND